MEGKEAEVFVKLVTKGLLLPAGLRKPAQGGKAGIQRTKDDRPRAAEVDDKHGIIGGIGVTKAQAGEEAEVGQRGEVIGVMRRRQGSDRKLLNAVSVRWNKGATSTAEVAKSTKHAAVNSAAKVAAKTVTKTEEGDAHSVVAFPSGDWLRGGLWHSAPNAERSHASRLAS